MCVHLVNNRSKQFLGSGGLIFHTIILFGQNWYQSTGSYLYYCIHVTCSTLHVYTIYYNSIAVPKDRYFITSVAGIRCLNVIPAVK